MKIKKLKRRLKKMSNEEFLEALMMGKYSIKQAALMATVAEIRFPTNR